MWEREAILLGGVQANTMLLFLCLTKIEYMTGYITSLPLIHGVLCPQF